MDAYTINIKINEKTNQIRITIESRYSFREFDILVTKDGLGIKANDTLMIIPETKNKIEIDVAK